MNPKVKSLYDALVADGDFVGTEKDFNDFFFASGDQGYYNRRDVYNLFAKAGADVGKNYEEFKDRIGWDAPHPKPAPNKTPRVEQAKPQDPLHNLPEQKGRKPAQAQQVQTQQNMPSMWPESAKHVPGTGVLMPTEKQVETASNAPAPSVAAMLENVRRVSSDTKGMLEEKVGQVKRLTETSTRDGRKNRDALHMQARLHGVGNQTFGAPEGLYGLTPPAPQNSEQTQNKQQSLPSVWPDSDKRKQGIGVLKPDEAKTATAPEFSSATMLEDARRKNNEAGVNTTISPKLYGVKFDDKGKPHVQWVLPDGRLTTDRIEADQAEFEARKNRRIVEESKVERKLERANAELEQMKAKLADAEKREAENSVWYKAFNAREGGLPGMASEFKTAAEKESKEVDAWKAAIRKKEEQISILKDEADRRKGIDVGFWRGFGNTVSDVRTWDFGISDMTDALTFLNADYYKHGTKEEQAAGQAMMKAAFERQQTEGEYADNASWWNRAGSMTGYMPSFMIDFALTGGGASSIKLFTKGASKAATKWFGRSIIEKIATAQSLKSFLRNEGFKGISKGFGEWTVKTLGTTLDDLLLRAPIMTNTVQAAKTGADIINRKLGDVKVDENGNYNFENDKSWGSAVWQAEANSIIENASEMSGERIGKQFGAISRAFEKHFAATTVGKMLTRAKSSDLGRIASIMNKRFEHLGISGTVEEGIEEYNGQLWRTMLGLDDAYKFNKDTGERENLFFDAQFHGDIWGGMVLSMGLMHAVKMGASGATYAYFKHRINKADQRGAAVMPGSWNGIRDIIDNVTNDDIGKLAASIVNDPRMTKAEKEAALNYFEASVAMRGNNFAELINSRGGDGSNEQLTVTSAFLAGYNNAVDKHAQARLQSAEARLLAQLYGLEDNELAQYIDFIDKHPTVAIQQSKDPEFAKVLVEYIVAKQYCYGMQQRAQDEQDAREAEAEAVDQSHENGRQTYERHAAGEADATEEVQQIGERLDVARQMCEDLFGDDAKYWMDRVEADAFDVAMEPTLDDEKRRAVLRYASALAAQRGVEAGVAEDKAAKRAEVERNVLSRTHKDQGMIIPAIMKTDDRQVFIVKGEIVMFPDGTAVDVNNSSESLVVWDPQAGEYLFVSSEDILRLEPAIDPQTEIAAAVAQAEAEIDDYLPPPSLDNLTEEDYAKMFDDIWKPWPGSEAQSENTQAQPAPAENAQPEAAPQEQPVPTPEAGLVPSEPAVPEQPQAQERAATAMSRIPVDESGSPVFEKATPEDAWNALVDRLNGNKDAARTVAAKQAEQAQADSERLQKETPTTTEAELSGDPMAMIDQMNTNNAANERAKAEHQAKLAEAQRKAEFWAQVGKVEGDRAAMEAERQRAEREAEEQRAKAQEEERQREAEVREYFKVFSDEELLEAIERHENQIAETKRDNPWDKPGIRYLEWAIDKSRTELERRAKERAQAEQEEAARAQESEQPATEEMTQAKNDTPVYEPATKSAAQEQVTDQTDNQGNPIDANGKLIAETVESVDEITDEDFINPQRTVQLPSLPENIANAIGTDGKPVIIKKNVFEKNLERHQDVTPDQGREILKAALYTPSLYGKNKLKTRPANWILIHLADKSGAVVLEVDHNKDNCEVVNWHYLGKKQLQQKIEQAEREGGRILTLDNTNAVGDTSQGLYSERKDNTLPTDKQASTQESSTEKAEKPAEKAPDGKATPELLQRIKELSAEMEAVKSTALEDVEVPEGTVDHNAVARDILKQRELAIKDKLIAETERLSDQEVKALSRKKGYGIMKDVLSERERRYTRAREAEQRRSEFEREYGHLAPLPNSKKKPKAFSMHEAVSTDSYRPMLTGVYHSPAGEAVASDTHILVVSKDDFNPDLEGKLVDKNGNEVTRKIVEGKGKDKVVTEKKVEGKFPAYERVIPKGKPVATAPLTDQVVQDACGVAAKKEAQASVVVNFGNGRFTKMDLHLWQKFLRAAKHIGATEIEFRDSNTALVARSEKGTALIMHTTVSPDNMYRQDLAGSDARISPDKTTGKTKFSVEDEQAQESQKPEERRAEITDETTNQHGTTLGEVKETAERWGGHTGVKVDVFIDVDQIDDPEAAEAIRNGKRVKGWYNSKTGKVGIYFPNTTDRYDMRKTIVHEVVAHKGLFHMLGEEGMQSFRAGVWRMMGDEAKLKMGRMYAGIIFDKGEWERMSDSERLEYLNKLDANQCQSLAEEYVASLAEHTDVQANRGMWRVIKSAINDLLRKAGLNVEYSESEIQDMLRRSYQNLRKEGGTKVAARGDVKFSVVEDFRGTGGKAKFVDRGDGVEIVQLHLNGKVFDKDHLLTVEDLKNSKRSAYVMLSEFARDLSGATDKAVDDYLNFQVSKLNLYLEVGADKESGVRELLGLFNYMGDQAAKPMSSNSDPQYSVSNDNSQLCRKNETMVNALARFARKAKRGVTPTDVVDMYVEVEKAGFQSPCPVCYVFTRYVNGGVWGSGAKGVQEHYADKLKEMERLAQMSDAEKDELRNFWVKELSEWQQWKKVNKTILDNAKVNVNVIGDHIDIMSRRLLLSRNGKGKKLSKAKEAELERRINALGELYQSSLELVAMQEWDMVIKNGILKKAGKSKGAVELEEPVEEESNDNGTLDPKKFELRPGGHKLWSPELNSLVPTANALRKCPGFEAYRGSRGSGGGKVAHQIADTAPGDFILGMGNGSEKHKYQFLEGVRPEFAEMETLNPDGTLSGKNDFANWIMKAVTSENDAEYEKYKGLAYTTAKKAIAEIKAQNYRGGVRVHSWSDFDPFYAGDSSAMWAEASLFGTALQSYMKQLEGVEVAGKVGININGSLIGDGIGYKSVPDSEVIERDGQTVWNRPFKVLDQKTKKPIDFYEPVVKDKDGGWIRLAFSDKLGAQYYGAEKNGKYIMGLYDLWNMYNSVNTITVAMDEKHCELLANDRRFQFFIPYHSSGGSSHILMGANAAQGIGLRGWGSVTNFEPVQNEGWIEDPTDKHAKTSIVPKYLAKFWEAHNANGKYKCGLGVIPSGDGAGRLSEQQRKYRRLVFLIKSSQPNKEPISEADLEIIKNDEFLSQMYQRIRVEGLKMRSDDKMHIYPPDYWDTTVSYDDSPVCTERYFELCRRMGVVPKFSGMNKKGESVGMGDLSRLPFMWKCLVDRAMYDRDGNYQEMAPVSIGGVTMRDFDPRQMAEKHDIKQRASDSDIEKIVDGVLLKNFGRFGDVPTVDRSKDRNDVVRDYNESADKDLTGWNKKDHLKSITARIDSIKKSLASCPKSKVAYYERVLNEQYQEYFDMFQDPEGTVRITDEARAKFGEWNKRVTEELDAEDRELELSGNAKFRVDNDEAHETSMRAIEECMRRGGIDYKVIEDHEEMREAVERGEARELRTSDGVVYGWRVDGKIRLTKDGIDAGKAVGEYSELWATAMQKNSPRAWRNIVSLLNGTEMWNVVVRDPMYDNLRGDENAIASEVLSRIGGAEGRRRFEEEAQRVLDNANTTTERARITAMIDRTRRAARSFWAWVGQNLFGIKKFKSIDEVTDRMLYDLTRGTKLDKGDKEKSLVGVHNISVDKIRKAMKMGGFANPSVAVIDVDRQLHDGFGEISLIIPNEKLNKGKQGSGGTYTGDAWTPSYPRVSYDMTADGVQKLVDDLESSFSKSEAALIGDWYMELFSKGRNPFQGDDMLFWFLKERGVTPKRSMNKWGDIGLVQMKSRTYLKEHPEMLKDFESWKQERQELYEVKELVSSSTAYGGKQVTLPHTLDNVSKIMNMGRSHGVGNGMAALMRPMKGTDDISKQQDRLVSSYEDLNIFDQNWEEAYRRTPYLTDESGLHMVNILGQKEYYKMMTQPNPIGYLKSKHGIELEEHKAKLFQQHIDAIRNERPAVYFETKFERPVMFNEFAAAVVPENTPADVVDFLRSQGLQIETYEADNKASRQEAMQRATQKEGVRFRLGDEESFEERQRRAVENRGTVTPGLMNKSVKIVDVPRHNYPGSYLQAEDLGVEDALKKYNHYEVDKRGRGEWVPYVQHYKNFGRLFDYVISRNGIKESINKEQKDKSKEQGAAYGVHLAALNHIDKIINESIEFEEHPDCEKVNGFRSIDKINPARIIHRFVGAIKIDGKQYRVITSLHEYRQKDMGNRQYAYDIAEIEVLDAVTTSTSNGAEGANYGLEPVAKLLNNLEKHYDPGKKILDESEKMSQMGAKFRVGDEATNESERSEMAASRMAPDSNLRFRVDDDVVTRDPVMARARYEARVASSQYQVKEAMLDSMLGLHDAYMAIEEASGRKRYIEDIASAENAYTAENALGSRNNEEQKLYERTMVRGITDEAAKLAKNEAELDDLRKYLMAKHGLERNPYMRNEAVAKAQAGKYANPQDQADAIARAQAADYSGLTGLFGKRKAADAEVAAAAFVQSYESNHNTTELWKRINAATKASLSKLKEGGIISQATHDKIANMYQYYVPLRGWAETTADEVYGYLTRDNADLRGSVMKKAEGRRSVADDPLATISLMGQQAIAEANRNKMKQAFFNYVRRNPSDLVSVNRLWLKKEGGVWMPALPDGPNKIYETDDMPTVLRKWEAHEAHMKQLAAAEPDLYKSGRQARNLPYKLGKGDLGQHQVLVKCGDDVYIMSINGNPRAAQALNGMTNPDAFGGRLEEWYKSINNRLAGLYTAYNPEFMIGNFCRDAIFANSIVHVKENEKYAWSYHGNFIKLLMPGKMLGLMNKHEKGKLGNSKLEKLFDEFVMNGGRTGYTAHTSIEEHKRKLDNMYKLAVGKKGLAGFKAICDIVKEKYLMLNESFEDCARFAAYITSRESGRDIGRSVYDAKEISVNFNRKGAGAKFMGATGQTSAGNVAAAVSGAGRGAYVFWNAGLQAVWGNFMKQAGRNPRKAMAMAATAFGTAIAVAMLNKFWLEDDDDEDNKYFNQPDFVRRSNIMVKAGKGFLSIPIPHELLPMYTMGELCASWLLGEKELTAEEVAAEAVGALMEFSPVKFTGNPTVPSMLRQLLPSSVRPVAEVIANEGWTGMPIYKDNQFNKDLPEWTQAYSKTDPALVNLSEAISRGDGGDDYKRADSEWYEWSPDAVQYLLNSYVGGPFKFLDKCIKTGYTVAGERPFDLSEVPMISRLYKRGDERTNARQLKAKFYNYQDKYRQTQGLISRYANDTKNPLEYAAKLSELAKGEDYQNYWVMKRYQKRLDDLDEQIGSVTDRGVERSLMAERNELMKEIIGKIEGSRPLEAIDTLGMQDSASKLAGKVGQPKASDVKRMARTPEMSRMLSDHDRIETALEDMKDRYSGNPDGYQKAVDGMWMELGEDARSEYYRVEAYNKRMRKLTAAYNKARTPEQRQEITNRITQLKM